MSDYSTIDQANKMKEIYEKHPRWGAYQFRVTEQWERFHLEVLWTCCYCNKEFWTRQIDGGLISCPECDEKAKKRNSEGMTRFEEESWEGWSDLEQQEERDA